MPKDGVAALLANLNPVTPVLLSAREWITVGPSGYLTGFWVVTFLATILMLFGWVVYRIAMPHLIARMSA
jgi:lipopolysaccharide transport system permease protein